MERTKWVDREFNFDFPQGWFFNIVERLYGTPARLKEFVLEMKESDAELRFNDKWSIKEHLGHLSDMEAMYESRIDSFIIGKTELGAADLNYSMENEFNHNTRTLDDLLQDFRSKRQRYIHRLESLDDDMHTRLSMHPRLQIMMRPVDVAYFTAEHDDHHIASMREVCRQIQKDKR